MTQFLIAESHNRHIKTLYEVAKHGSQRFFTLIKPLDQDMDISPETPPFEPGLSLPAELEVLILKQVVDWHLTNKDFEEAINLISTSKLLIHHYHDTYVKQSNDIVLWKQRNISRLIYMTRQLFTTVIQHQNDFHDQYVVTEVESQYNQTDCMIVKNQLRCTFALNHRDETFPTRRPLDQEAIGPLDFLRRRFHDETYTVEYRMTSCIRPVIMDCPEYRALLTGTTMGDIAWLYGQMGPKYFRATAFKRPVFVLLLQDPFCNLFKINLRNAHDKTPWVKWKQMLQLVFGDKTALFIVNQDPPPLTLIDDQRYVITEVQ